MLRFSDLLQDEMTLFPGITADTLNTIDKRQIKSKFLEKVDDDLYVFQHYKKVEKYLFIMI